MAQGLRLIVPSLAVGALAAWILSQFMTPLLYQTQAGDSFTFAATIALLLAVGLAGCYNSCAQGDGGQSFAGDTD